MASENLTFKFGQCSSNIFITSVTVKSYSLAIDLKVHIDANFSNNLFFNDFVIELLVKWPML